MNLGRRIFFISFVLFAAISSFGYFFWYKPKFSKCLATKVFAYEANISSAKREVLSRLKLKAAEAKTYVVEHGFSRTHCFLVDMRVTSGKKRFFVYNLVKDSVEIAGLVTHGSGSYNGTDDLIFSNVKNSNCTSIGKYKVGTSYSGSFGLAYKLYGLDNTNSNAFDRFVVLHSHACVPNDEVYPLPICVSLGCPTVSPAFLNALKLYLDEPQRPVLLWIYY